MYLLFKEFKINLILGLRLALVRPCKLDEFRFSHDQLILLMTFDLILQIAADFFSQLPKREFETQLLTSHFYILLSIPLAVMFFGWLFTWGKDLRRILFITSSLPPLSMLWQVFTRFLDKQPSLEFNSYALFAYAFCTICFLLAIYFIGKLSGNTTASLQFGVIVCSVLPITISIQFLLTYLNRHELLPHLAKSCCRIPIPLVIYQIILLCRISYLVNNRQISLTPAGVFIMAFAIALPKLYFKESGNFWYETEPEFTEDSSYEDAHGFDAENLLYQQYTLMDSALIKLKPQRKKHTDIYFVGFAGYADEDVFSNEVSYAKQLFDARFDTKGRSINLVNHIKTIQQTPLATATNLALTLKKLGDKIDTEDDVLFLYLTSHGSKDHELSVSFWPLALNNVTPEKLRNMLDEAKIKWRVLVISACYSGGFIDQLRSPTTLIATASSATRKSFGCGSESRFTYFGEALFEQQLTHKSSFITALKEVEISIKQREIHEKLKASMPQLSIGKDIEPKLNKLSQEIQRFQCNIDRKNDLNCKK